MEYSGTSTHAPVSTMKLSVISIPIEISVYVCDSSEILEYQRLVDMSLKIFILIWLLNLFRFMYLQCTLVSISRLSCECSCPFLLPDTKWSKLFNVSGSLINCISNIFQSDSRGPYKFESLISNIILTPTEITRTYNILCTISSQS